MVYFGMETLLVIPIFCIFAGVGLHQWDELLLLGVQGMYDKMTP